MANSRGGAWRRTYYGAPCRPRLVSVNFAGVTRAVDSRTAAAFRALAATIVTVGYPVRGRDTGVYNCRKVGGSSTWSPHAWAIAIDINWQDNPYGTRPKPPMTRLAIEIEKIRTNSGHKVFGWGGRWRTPDPMHFEIVCTPRQLATGISGATRAVSGDTPQPVTTSNTLEVNMKLGHSNKDEVTNFQQLYNLWHEMFNKRAKLDSGQGHTNRPILVVDGDFGPATNNSVHFAQSQMAPRYGYRGEDGTVDWALVTFMQIYIENARNYIHSKGGLHR